MAKLAQFLTTERLSSLSEKEYLILKGQIDHHLEHSPEVQKSLETLIKSVAEKLKTSSSK